MRVCLRANPNKNTVPVARNIAGTAMASSYGGKAFLCESELRIEDLRRWVGCGIGLRVAHSGFEHGVWGFRQDLGPIQSLEGGCKLEPEPPEALPKLQAQKH